jgi:hypothetical protein
MQTRDFAGSDALDLRHDAAHGLAGQRPACACRRGCADPDFRFRGGELERVFDGDKELFSGERLLKKVQRAEARGADGHLDVRLAAHHHHGSGDAGVLQVFKQGQTVAAGHDHVAENQVEGLRAGQFQRAYGVVADHSFMAREAEGAGERCQRVGLVVDDEDVGLAVINSLSVVACLLFMISPRETATCFGSVMTKVAPPPGRLSTAMVPAWSA